MKIYKEMKTLQFVSGSTLPAFQIDVNTTDVDGNEIPADVTGCTMRVIVAKAGSDTTAVLQKECTAVSGGFQCRLTSEDTAGWFGRYSVHFALYNSEGIVYRNLYGYFDVVPAPESHELLDNSTSTPSLSDLTLHLSDTTVHITAQERIAWNACIDDLEALTETVETQAAAIARTQNQLALCAAPMQDASVEGRYLLFAEYTFPQAANFESSDVTFSVRNRGVSATAEDGILRVRLRYGKAAAAFQYAQIYWTQNSGIDPAKFILCCNNATGTAQLWLDASTAYAGYICKVLDMGTSAQVVDFSAWTLYSPTTGTAELPLESDGWTTVTSTDPAAAAE